MIKLPVQNQSVLDNVYFCCTQKTASQWIRGVLSNQLVYSYCGLDVVPYRELGLRFAHFDEAFPVRSIAAHLYIDHQTFLGIPKPARYKTFFVLRDPRDIIVSWYFSARHSHKSMGPVPDLRATLETLSQDEGLCFMIDQLEDWGSFAAQRSWAGIRDTDDFRLFRYEDLARDNEAFMQELLDYLDIHLPAVVFRRVLDTHRFENYAEGRSPGSENIMSHFRSGVTGDHCRYFTNRVNTRFKQAAGDLLAVLGYK